MGQSTQLPDTAVGLYPCAGGEGLGLEAKLRGLMAGPELSSQLGAPLLLSFQVSRHMGLHAS